MHADVKDENADPNSMHGSIPMELYYVAVGRGCRNVARELRQAFNIMRLFVPKDLMCWLARTWAECSAHSECNARSSLMRHTIESWLVEIAKSPRRFKKKRRVVYENTLGQRYPVKHFIDKTIIPNITDDDESSCASLTEAVTDSELHDINVATFNAT